MPCCSCITHLIRLYMYGESAKQGGEQHVLFDIRRIWTDNIFICVCLSIDWIIQRTGPGENCLITGILCEIKYTADDE